MGTALSRLVSDYASRGDRGRGEKKEGLKILPPQLLSLVQTGVREGAADTDSSVLRTVMGPQYEIWRTERAQQEQRIFLDWILKKENRLRVRGRIKEFVSE